MNSQRQQPPHEEKSTAFSILAFSHKPNFTIRIVAIFNNSIKMGGGRTCDKVFVEDRLNAQFSYFENEISVPGIISLLSFRSPFNHELLS